METSRLGWRVQAPWRGEAPWRVEGRVAGAAGFVPESVVECVAARGVRARGRGGRDDRRDDRRGEHDGRPREYDGRSSIAPVADDGAAPGMDGGGAPDADGGGAPDATAPSDPASWVDAVVTLLAIVIFGLGWALFELDGAEQAMRDYDLPRAETRLAALAPLPQAMAAEAVPVAERVSATEIEWPISPIATSNASSTR